MADDESPDGINLQLPNGKPVKAVLMDESDEFLDLDANPEAGVFGFTNGETTVTMFLEER